MKILRALLALALLLTPVRALAQEAKALTADCVITSGKVKTVAAHDGDYTTAWRSERVRRPYLEFQLPEGETAGYLYVCFTEMPQSWAVEERVDGKWRVVAEGGTDYLHALVELNGQNHFRIVENSGVTTRLKFNEVFVFGAGELPDWAQRTNLTLKDSAGSVVVQGDAAAFAMYAYPKNGSYELTLTAYRNTADPGDATGWYRYCASYTMNIQPKAVLSSERVSQGGVAALVITGILDGSEPTVETDLGDVWFRPVTGGYMGYIPVTYNAEGGPHTLTVTCGSLIQELTLSVMQSEAKTVDVAAEADIPGAATEYKNAIWPLYTQGSSEKLWQGNFASPVPSAILADYGARLRTDGTITGRATGINYNAAAGTAVTAPQAGTVVYAGTLALTGGTVVIDHGCGVRSYLFGLDAVKVQRGQSLARGEELGTTSEEHTLIWELRIGSKSVDPAAALTGSSGLLYRETM